MSSFCHSGFRPCRATPGGPPTLQWSVGYGRDACAARSVTDPVELSRAYLDQRYAFYVSSLSFTEMPSNPAT